MAPLTSWDIERMERDLSQYKELIIRKEAQVLVATTDERRNQLKSELQAHREAVATIKRDIREFNSLS